MEWQKDLFRNLFPIWYWRWFHKENIFSAPRPDAKKSSRRFKKSHWDFGDGQFDSIPTFSMGPLEDGELLKLARQIV